METPDYAVIARDYLAKTGLDKRLTEEDKARFVNYAKTYSLDPYKREIHCILDEEGYKIVVGYETYIKRAEATGFLNGWTSWVEGADDSTMKAVVEIYRKDWANPFKHEVYLIVRLCSAFSNSSNRSPPKTKASSHKTKLCSSV